MNIPEQIIANPEGGTVSLDGSPLPDYGFFVGGAGKPLVFDNLGVAMDQNTISAFLHCASSGYVGWWTDSKDRKVYIDSTDWFASPDEAFDAGRVRGEIAIWDIEYQRELRFTYTPVDGF